MTMTTLPKHAQDLTDHNWEVIKTILASGEQVVPTLVIMSAAPDEPNGIAVALGQVDELLQSGEGKHALGQAILGFLKDPATLALSMVMEARILSILPDDERLAKMRSGEMGMADVPDSEKSDIVMEQLAYRESDDSTVRFRTTSYVTRDADGEARSLNESAMTQLGVAPEIWFGVNLKEELNGVSGSEGSGL